ncbi:MAG: hypothetical protein GTO53_02695 [Planctomycetales bacterium]|nr:hypothetical protein [Planctomycetales bacterium]NIM08078.1 hypothetical protein [Planctomycetales bacterium]NIN07569.1 hypothetical protein [Planctomycetales bacterium]NIN76680.1 hypothetical protein [Planctomycetales bacterium]NIO33868.1 hypothetical protein [Planctomycetales bacterium]
MTLLDSDPQRLCGEDRLICHCFGVTEMVIRESIDILGSCTIEQVTACTGAGAGCTACHCRIKRMLAGEAVTCSPFAVCGDCGFFTPLCACKAA